MWSYFESIDLEDGSSEERKAIVAVFKLVADIGCADSGFADSGFAGRGRLEPEPAIRSEQNCISAQFELALQTLFLPQQNHCAAASEAAPNNLAI